MKVRIASLLAMFACVVALSVPVVTRAAQSSIAKTGWISDSMCGAMGAKASHKDCAIKCVKDKGAKWVFVDAKSKRVYEIKNQDAINAEKDLGKEVKVTGVMAGKNMLDVRNVAPAM